MKKRDFFNLRSIITLVMCFVVSIGFAQNLRVHGTVKDTRGDAVIGASIIIKGDATKGASTDIDGNYSINNVPQNATLVVSSIGMKTQEVAVSGKSVINITMKDDTELLNEVVVVGYGTQKKVNLTGSVFC